MDRAYAIALNAFREAVRDRILFGVLGLALASLLFGTTLAWLSVSEQIRVLIDHGIVTISWLSNIVAIFLGASFLYKEIELRTLYVILAKPVARWQFVLGRYLGILTTAAVFIALTASMLMLLVAFVTAEARGGDGAALTGITHALRGSRGSRAGLFVVGLLAFATLARVTQKHRFFARIRGVFAGTGAVLGSFGLCAMTAAITYSIAPEETVYLALSMLLVLLEVSVTAAIATLVSSFSTPFVTGAMSLGLFLIGRSTGSILELRSRQLPAEVLRVLRLVAEVFPNLHLYVPSRQNLSTVQGSGPVLQFVGQLSLYAAFYGAICVLAASWFFRRRDLV
jgi:ABC-type transport system involved in multi-copper enzyme maturation permease subunit